MKHFNFTFLSIITVFFALLPFASYADTVELISISNGAQDITSFMEDMDAPADVKIFVFSGTAGEEYTAVFAVDKEPAVVVAPGADITQNWTYNETEGTVTVNLRAIKLVGFDVPEQVDIFIIGTVFPVEHGEDGPPEEAAGMWMSTNLTEWEMIPPDEGSPQFGFELTGPAGTTGVFHMFLPDTLIDLLGTLSGKPLDINDLAVFIDDDQASMNISKVEGGALIEINVKFTDKATLVSEAISALVQPSLPSVANLTSVVSKNAASAKVTKRIIAKERLAVSLAAKKYRVKKKEEVKLFGWIKSGNENEKISLYKKIGNKNKFKEVETTKTEKNGYFTFTVKPKKTTLYKVKSDEEFSPAKRISVEK